MPPNLSSKSAPRAPSSQSAAAPTTSLTEAYCCHFQSRLPRVVNACARCKSGHYMRRSRKKYFWSVLQKCSVRAAATTTSPTESYCCHVQSRLPRFVNACARYKSRHCMRRSKKRLVCPSEVLCSRRRQNGLTDRGPLLPLSIAFASICQRQRALQV